MTGLESRQQSHSDPLAGARFRAQNRHTLLGFVRSGQEAEYQAWRISENRQRTSQALAVAAAVFALFALKDLLVRPEGLGLLSAGVQLGGIVPILLLTALFTRHAGPTRYQLQLVLMWVLIAPAIIGVMAVGQAAGHTVPYEVLLIMIVSLSLFTCMLPVVALGVGLFACSVYVALLHDAGLDATVLAGQGFYLLVTSILSVLGAHHLDRAQRMRFLNETRLSQEAQTDPLTNLPNRRAAELAFETVWRLAYRNHTTVSVIYLDLDHFKRLNDSSGHPAGDDALSRVANALSKSLDRPLDFAGRLGGEEFIVITYGLDRTATTLLGEKLRKAVEKVGIYHPDSPVAQHVTVSVGATLCEPWEPDPSFLLWQSADTALYCAKRDGRNRVHFDLTERPGAGHASRTWHDHKQAPPTLPRAAAPPNPAASKTA